MSERVLQLRCDLAVILAAMPQVHESVRPLVEQKARRAALELHELHELITECSDPPPDFGLGVPDQADVEELLDVVDTGPWHFKGECPPEGDPRR